MTVSVLDYLRELVELTGPSGAEQDVVRYIYHRVKPLADSVEMDAFGNVIAVRQASRQGARRVLLAAHMDEVGFVVRKIEPDGFLRFEKLGGTDNRVLLGQRVWVRGERARLLGIIGTRSAHLLRDQDRTSVPHHTELYIDIGARDGDQVRAMGVREGTPVGYVGELAELGSNTGRYVGHALDDRVGCAVLLTLFDTVQGQDLPVTIVGLFTVQEEVGLRGAHVLARSQPGDIGLAIDTTATDDTPEIRTNHLQLGAGAAIKVLDNSQIAHPAVRQGMEAAAHRAQVPIQFEILMGIGTDAGALQFSSAGLPAGTLSVGTRYTHTPVEVLDVRDLEGAVSLLREFVLSAAEMDLTFTSLDGPSATAQ